MSNLTMAQTDRVIQMAWEDRTTFEAIREQFGLGEEDLNFMLEVDFNKDGHIGNPEFQFLIQRMGQPLGPAGFVPRDPNVQPSVLDCP